MDMKKEASISANPLALNLVVGIAGGATMAFELAALRILAPYMGGSIFVTTSVLAVVLSGLAIGSFIGGRFADYSPKTETLGALLLWASLLIALTHAFDDLLLNWFASCNLDIRLNSLLASLILFGPATICFGAIMPFALKLKPIGVNRLGSAAGALSACSALGSLLGTLIAGYLFFSFIGTSALLLFCSIVMGVSGIFFLQHGRRSGVASLLLIILSVIWLLSWYSRPFADAVELESQYGRYWVVDSVDKPSGRQLRSLVTMRGLFQSAIYLDSLEENSEETDPFYSLEQKMGLKEPYFLKYLRYFDLVEPLLPSKSRALLIGGGAFTYPGRFFKLSPESQIDVVELDPALWSLATKYFGLKEDPRVRVVEADGRQFVRAKEANSYDAIFLDVFDSGFQFPWYLGTKEALTGYRRILKERGVLAMNLLASISGRSSKQLQGLLATFEQTFKHVSIFAVKSPMEKSIVQNFVIIASQSTELSWSADDPQWQLASVGSLDKKQFLGGTIYTDDSSASELFAPRSFGE